MSLATFLSAVEATGKPALRIAFPIALVVLIGAGAFIYRRRHRFFDRDPDVAEDPPVVRHNRAEEIILVWGALTLVVLSILYQVWFD